jgi:hypothetical protein
MAASSHRLKSTTPHSLSQRVTTSNDDDNDAISLLHSSNMSILSSLSLPLPATTTLSTRHLSNRFTAMSIGMDIFIHNIFTVYYSAAENVTA